MSRSQGSVGPFIEVSVHSAILAGAALKAGVDALEICNKNMTTPTQELFTQIKEIIRQIKFDDAEWERFPVTICIRPHTNSFVYNATELNMMLEDIQVFKEEPLVKGFTIAALTSNGDLDIETMTKLQKAILPKQISFSGRAMEFVSGNTLKSVLYNLHTKMRGIAHIRCEEILTLERPHCPENNLALTLAEMSGSIMKRSMHSSPSWKITTSLSCGFMSRTFLEHPYVFFLLHNHSRSTLDEFGLDFLDNRLILATSKDDYARKGRKTAIELERTISKIHYASIKAWDDYIMSNRSISSPGHVVRRLLHSYATEQGMDITEILEPYGVDIWELGNST